MRTGKFGILIFILAVVLVSAPAGKAAAQYPDAKSDLDRKVISFLKEQAGQWKDMNVPVSDGRILYELVMKGNYRKALEIGTSTGHSAVWLAWALSKTGGKLVTIEIDKQRYLEALRNFKNSGLSEFIDARLGDAHDIVPALGPGWDFVFCDADRWWYKNYFMALETKMISGGCFAAHNTNTQSSDMKEFNSYIRKHPEFVTTFNRTSRSGISISYKK